MQYHPKLKKAMQEVNDILSKYDIGALVVLHTPGFVEYKLKTDPSYSVAKWNGEELRVRAKLKEDYDNDVESWTEDVTNTLNMLQCIAEAGGGLSVKLFELADTISKKVKAQHYRGPDSSHNSQNN